MHRHHPAFGVDDPDESRPRGEVIGRLRVDLTGTMGRREDFDGKIGGAPEEASEIRYGIPPLAGHERDVGAAHGVGVAREEEASIAQNLAKTVTSRECVQEHDRSRLDLRVQKERTRFGEKETGLQLVAEAYDRCLPSSTRCAPFRVAFRIQ